MLGAWLAAVVAGLCFGSYQLGMNDGIAKVVYDCNYYQRYAVDGADMLICSGIVDRQGLIDQAVQHASQPLEKPKRKK